MNKLKAVVVADFYYLHKRTTRLLNVLNAN